MFSHCTKNEIQTPYLEYKLLYDLAPICHANLLSNHHYSPYLSYIGDLSTPWVSQAHLYHRAFTPIVAYVYIAFFSNSLQDLLLLIIHICLKSPLPWPLYLKEYLALSPDNISHCLILFSYLLYLFFFLGRLYYFQQIVTLSHSIPYERLVPHQSVDLRLGHTTCFGHWNAVGSDKEIYGAW